MPLLPLDIEYSEKYYDQSYEYRHVLLSETVFSALKILGLGRILSENEWRNLGVQQSRGWEHYLVYEPEPWVLLFRKPIDETDIDHQRKLMNLRHM